MPVSADVKLYCKGIIVALLGILVAAWGISAVGIFRDNFEVNPCYSPIMLTDSLGIDMLGAVVPLVAALVFLAVFVKSAKYPLKKTAIAFSASIIVAFLLCHQTPDGISGHPLPFALSVGIIAAVVNVYPKPFSDLRKSLFASLLLALACVPVSLLLVDLAYLPYFSGVVIGGNGLADGLMLSTLYAPFAVAVVFSAIAYVSQTVTLVQKYHATKLRPPALIGAVAKENPSSAR
jgi:hypothetical protein